MFAAALSLVLSRQDLPPVKEQYTKTEAMVPMRDGIRLYTAIYTPKDSAEKHPILMTRTPYSCGPYGPNELPGSFRVYAWHRVGSGKSVPERVNAFETASMRNLCSDRGGEQRASGERRAARCARRTFLCGEHDHRFG